jgi:large conductance mechanosensitive channel
MKNILKEFREFASRGNVVELAVGVIIGGAFGKIVTSLVDDIVMPPIGLILGGVNFEEIRIILKAAQLDAAGEITSPEVAIRVGAFLQTSLNFVIIAFAIFLMVKGINALRREIERREKAQLKLEAKVEEVHKITEIEVLQEIRDLLKK